MRPTRSPGCSARRSTGDFCLQGHRRVAVDGLKPEMPVQGQSPDVVSLRGQGDPQRPLGRSRIPNAGQERTADALATVAIRYVQVPELPKVPEPQGSGGRCDERHASGLAVAVCEEPTKTTTGKLRCQPVPDFNHVSRLPVVASVA